MQSLGKSGESWILESIFKEGEVDVLKTKILPLIQKIRVPKAKAFVKINPRYTDEHGHDVEAVEMDIPKIQLKRGFSSGPKFFVYIDSSSDIVVEQESIESETFANDDHGIKEVVDWIKERVVETVKNA
jgi:hypothetical protein